LVTVGAVWAKAVEADTTSRTMLVMKRMTISLKFRMVRTRARFCYAPIVAMAATIYSYMGQKAV
jgi:hypothetical protein